jgi:hypothetical protein
MAGGCSSILQSLEPPQSYAGRLRIEGPRLRDAPAMAELLNLISVVGLLEQLSGDGINLGTVDARFTLTPGRLTLTEGAAVGPSLGISMDGVYDTAMPPIRHAGGCVPALHGQWARRRALRAAPGGAFRVFLPPDRHGAAIQRVREPPVDPDPRHLPRDLPPPAAGADRDADRMKLDDFDFDLPER